MIHDVIMSSLTFPGAMERIIEAMQAERDNQCNRKTMWIRTCQINHRTVYMLNRRNTERKRARDTEGERRREMELAILCRDQFERHRLSGSRTNTDYMTCNDDSISRNHEEIQIGDDGRNTVTKCKYIGPIFYSTGGSE